MQIGSDRILATLGAFALAVSLSRPWFEIPLEPDRNAFELSVLIPGLSSRIGASFGLLTVACLLVAIAGLVASRGRGGRTPGFAGVAAMAVPVLFLVQVSVTDWRLEGHLATQDQMFKSITAQFGYGIPQSGPTSLLTIPIEGTWRLASANLGQGWYLALVGGLLLMVAYGLQPQPGRPGSLPRTWRDLLAGVASAAGLIFAANLPGSLGNMAAAHGAALASSGDYRGALDQYATAVRMNPLLTYQVEFESDRGYALAQYGDTRSPLTLLARARQSAADGDPVQEVVDLEHAESMIRAVPINDGNTAGIQAPDGTSTVIRDELILATQERAQALHDPALLLDLLSAGFDRVDVRYTAGRLLFAKHAYTQAIGQLRSAASETENTDVRSSAVTYVALSEESLGYTDQARRDLLLAVALDTHYYNTDARVAALGLFSHASTQ